MPHHPRQHYELIGQQEAEQHIVQAAKGGRMPHAWLLAGPEGVGKATLAYRMARFFLSGLPMGEDLSISRDMPAAKMIAAGSHPDLLVLERSFDEKKNKLHKNISIDDVRKIEPFLRLTSSQGFWRVALIDGADTLSHEGQNALLKILEEPPSHSLLILTAGNASALLTTIRSRCRVLKLPALSEKDMRLLAARLPDGAGEGARADFYIAAAEGSVARLMRYSACGADVFYSAWCDFLRDPGNAYTRLRMAESWSERGNEALYATATEMMAAWLHRLIAAKARGEEPEALTEEEKPLVSGLYPQLHLARLMELWDTLAAQERQTEQSNLDRKTALLTMLDCTATALAA